MIKTLVIPMAGNSTRVMGLQGKRKKDLFLFKNHKAIEYILQEAKEADIKNIILVISDDRKLEVKKLISKSDLKIKWVLQKSPLGIYNAIEQALCKFKDKFFAVALPDNIFKYNTLKKLKNNFNDKNAIGYASVSKNEINKYGLLIIKNNILIDFHEKPSIEKLSILNIKNKNNYFAAMGRYIFSREFFYQDIDETILQSENGFSTAIKSIINRDKFMAIDISGKFFDIGSKEGYYAFQNYINKKDTKL